MRARLKKILRIVIIALPVIMIVYYFYHEEKFPPGVTIDKIEIYKSQSRMLVYSKGQLIKTYKVSIGGNPAGRKEFEGDRKTPEGIYFINAKNPHSDFYKNLGVSYPSGDDIQRARKLGKQVGGDIKIHGIKNGLGFIGKFQRWINWTAG
ncbi:MAG: L,D-transpeptidase family protein, partial [Mucilaginibacter sp.]